MPGEFNEIEYVFPETAFGSDQDKTAEVSVILVALIFCGGLHCD